MVLHTCPFHVAALFSAQQPPPPRCSGVFICLFHTPPLFHPPMPFNDIQKQREASRRHYAKHKERVIAKAKVYSKAARERVRTHINTHLQNNPCVDCGETNIIVLEFDHVGEAGTKKFNISDATRRGYGMNKIKAEIEKCEVRCANCHRKKTYERGGWVHRG